MKSFLLVCTLFLSTAYADNAMSLQGEYVLTQDPTESLDGSGCSVRSRMVLNSHDGKSVAEVSDYIEGLCLIHVPDNSRTIELTLRGEYCGSRTFEGSGTDSEGEVFQMVVIDHSDRTCRDTVPSLLEVEESNRHEVKTLYSLQKPKRKFFIQPAFPIED